MVTLPLAGSVKVPNPPSQNATMRCAPGKASASVLMSRGSWAMPALHGEPETAMTSAEVTVGRYALHHEIASGGMAVVHIGRLLGPVGFSRTVAIKRLHPHFARNPEFVAMFLDEARLAARIRHPNVVSTLDVVATEGELFVVMEYVPGESLARLLSRRASERSERGPAFRCGQHHGRRAAGPARRARGAATSAGSR